MPSVSPRITTSSMRFASHAYSSYADPHPSLGWKGSRTGCSVFSDTVYPQNLWDVEICDLRGECLPWPGKALAGFSWYGSTSELVGVDGSGSDLSSNPSNSRSIDPVDIQYLI